MSVLLGKETDMDKKAGKEKLVMLKNIIVTLLVITFFVGILLAFYNMLYEEKRDNIINKGEATAYKTTTQFNEYLLTGLAALKTTSYTLDGMLRNKKSNSEILEFLVGPIFVERGGTYALDGASCQGGFHDVIPSQHEGRSDSPVIYLE